MLHLVLGDADTRIGHDDDCLLGGDAYRERNLAARLIVFHGVVEQVIEHLLHLVGVKPCRLAHATDVLAEGELLRREHRHETASGRGAEVTQLALTYPELQLACL